MSIVATDATFEATNNPAAGFVGKCIHCGRKLFVGLAGNTAATVEHIVPLCNGGDPMDPRNLALACGGCNSEKGVRHDKHAGKGGRADEVIAALLARRQARWPASLNALDAVNVNEQPDR